MGTTKDVWNHKDMMRIYLMNKYGFKVIKFAKDIKDNILIGLCYYEEPGKIYRHSFTMDEIDKVLLLREKKLERIIK